MQVRKNFTIIPVKTDDPRMIIKQAVDSETGKILGTINAEKCENKSYSWWSTNGRKSSKTVKKPHIYVSDLYVNPEVRNQHIGTRLITDIIEESEKRGFEGRVTLFAGNSRKGEPSPLPFYRRIGFSSGERYLNKRLDTFNSSRLGVFSKDVLSFMSLPRDVALKILKAIR